ncbi:1-phosphatidylinositol-4-phosphate 5-kinase [Ranunculus cassubicifolius]
MELPMRELTHLDFHSTNSTWIRFPKQRLPSGTVTDFEWKDYCPHVFRNLQQLDNISYADYMVSICAHETLRELTLKGKSGTLRFSPDDRRFVIRIIRKSELKVLLEMLPNYYDHVLTYVNTLLNKLYGIHVVRPAGGCKIHFVVTGNIIQSDLFIHRCYDLKGSSQGRSLNKAAVDDFTLFKDLDLELYFLLNPLTRHQVLAQIKHDCEFLEAAGIMDYSLLLGIHIKASTRGSFNGSTNSRTSENKFSLPPDSSWSQGDGESSSNDNQNYYEPDVRLGREMSARAIQIPKHDPESNSPHRLYPSGEPFNVKLNFGIIDILKGYSVKKRIEHMYKSIQFDSRSISAVNPRVYSTRFQEFLSRVFQSEDSTVL